MNSCVDIEYKCGELSKLDQVASVATRFDGISFKLGMQY